ncbi:DUF4136 domain-containing protein [Marinobacteraceae bacterium S3BR75-40.1]
MPRVLLILFVFLYGCASPIMLDYDAGSPFASYQDYAFADSSGDFQGLDQKRMREALRAALDRKRLQPVDKKDADLLVNFGLETVERIERTGVGMGFGFFNSPFGVGVSSRPPARKVEEQQLFVELVDAGSRSVVWRAVSREHLTPSMEPDERKETIDEMIKAMFERYPP